MLFLTFQLGKDRYALEASRVVEVLPLLELKEIPCAPRGVAGVFNFRGSPVPAIDLSALTSGHPAAERMSTRFIVIRYPDENGKEHLLGLIAEQATDMIRRDENEFIDTGLKLDTAPFLGPILMDGRSQIQRIYSQHLLTPEVHQKLFPQEKEQHA